jgi:agmatinase
MRHNPKQFLLADEAFTDFARSAAVILPVPFEGGISYGKGTAQAPRAVIDASYFVEFYDEVLKAEPYRMGITTMAEVKARKGQTIHDAVYKAVDELLLHKKFVAMVGGDHSVSYGCFRAVQRHHPQCSVIQLDAHADLRPSYDGSPFSHACIMARIRELTPQALQIGIRALCVEEAREIEKNHYPVATMHEFRHGGFNLETALDRLPDPVYLTVDVDVFDWSVIYSTGTPEPGGFTWDEGLHVLEKIFSQKNVVGFDVVELSYTPLNPNSTFATAKLLYKMLGFKLADLVRRKLKTWPITPNGSLFY